VLFATNDRTLGTCFVGKDCQADLPIYLWAHLHKHRLYFEKDTDTCLLFSFTFLERKAHALD
jgi:hypothetical protein